MAKVKLTRKNFTNFINMEDMGIEGMFMNALTGGRAKEMVQNLPDEQAVRIDTDRVVAVGSLTKFEETGDVVFQIFLDCNEPKMQNMWIKGDDYIPFLKVWSSGVSPLYEGEYTVDADCYAISEDDGKKVIVRRNKENE